MKEEKNTLLTEEDIHDLLSPKCDFHASPGVMERVMKEIEVLPTPKISLGIWWRYAGVAAAIGLLIVASILVVDKAENQADAPVVASEIAHVEDARNGSTKLVEVEVKDEIPGKTSENEENPSLKNKIMNQQNVILAEKIEKTGEHAERQYAKSEEEIQEQSATIEGPMSSRSDLEARNSNKLSFSTEECDEYTRMVRQSYIERVRLEIAETAIYVREMRESVIESI